MPKGVYNRKKEVKEPETPVSAEPVAEETPVVETQIQETKEEPEKEPFEALIKTGFVVPNYAVQSWKNKNTNKTAVRWGIKHLNGAAEVYEGTKFVRVYRLDIHGKDYLKLAEQIVKKKNSLLE